MIRKITFLGSLILAFMILASLVSVEVTSTPRFCGTCHNMHPYYESWKKSSHNQIACVDCHIPPGLTSEVRKKFEALSMVAKYFTATYGTHPWAEIDDVNCLQCHDRRLIAGKVTYKDILFDHSPHLTEMRRGKKLRCTSCHSQIVQGSHIAVTFSTCFLCHFKGQTVGVGTARCLLCHEVPNKVIERQGVSFHHADVKRFDMKCEWCHAKVVSGAGDVPKARCYQCHAEASRLDKYEDNELLHKIHVTEHKVECLHCHNEIQHGILKEVHEEKGECQNCHAGGHSPQQALYAGTGGKGIEPGPSPMYLAGIACQGCHFFPKESQGNEIMRASALSCMACHGASFNAIYDQWQTVTADRFQKTKAILTRAESQMNSPYPQAFQDAQDNIRLLERGHPVHNVSYSLALMDQSVQMINQSLKEKGKAPIPVPWVSVPFQSRCLSCHQGIETKEGTYRGKRFVHYPHVVKNELECETCHVAHEIPRKKNISVFQEDFSCGTCHHQEGAPVACETCHKQDISQTVKVQGTVLDRKGLMFDHAMHIEATERKCQDCHLEKGNFRRTPVAAQCADCHE